MTRVVDLTAEMSRRRATRATTAAASRQALINEAGRLMALAAQAGEIRPMIGGRIVQSPVRRGPRYAPKMG